MCDILAPLLVVLGDGMCMYAHSVVRQTHPYPPLVCLLCTATNIHTVFCIVYLKATNLMMSWSHPTTSIVLSAESLVYQCYVQQMERMQHHFPPNQGVSEKLANLRALVEVRQSPTLPLCIGCSHHFCCHAYLCEPICCCLSL